MQIELRTIVKPSVTRVFVYAVVGLIVWFATYVGSFYTLGDDFKEVFSDLLQKDLIWKNITSILLTFLNSFLLSQLLNRFGFVSVRTFLPVFAFALLMIVWEPAHVLYTSNVALLLFILALFQFFEMHRNQFATEKAFLGTFLIALSALLINDLIFLLPVCWLGFATFRSLSLRVFLASLLGALTPWVLYTAILYIFLPDFSLHGLLNFQFSFGFSMEELQIPTKIYIGVLFAIFIILLIGTYTEFHKNVNTTRKNINFVLFLLFYFLLFFALQEDFLGTFFPFIAFCFAAFIANIFSSKQTKFYSILFLVFLIVNIAFVFYNFLW